jgi:hypothetical protein
MPVPYIVNFSMVDGDGDGTISADEFEAGCAQEMVKSTQPESRKPWASSAKNPGACPRRGFLFAPGDAPAIV